MVDPGEAKGRGPVVDAKGWRLGRNLKPEALRPKYLSAFHSVKSFDALLRSGSDSILTLDQTAAAGGAYLDDLGGQNYILCLNDAVVISPRAMRLPPGVEVSSPLPAGLTQTRRRCPLILTGRHELFADSFQRSQAVNETLVWRPDGAWRASIPRRLERIRGVSVLVELVCGHFGHALVDVPARLWPHQFQQLGPDVNFIAFGTHKVTSDAATRPPFLNELLTAYDVPLDRIRIIETPVRCDKLIVAKRISPFIGPSGPEYNQFMVRAGDAIAGSQTPSDLPEKIYLSRSRVAKRKLNPGAEEELEQVFSGLGYTVVHPQEHTLGRQIQFVRAAKKIAGCIGSQLHLTAFRERGGGFDMLRIAPSFFRPAVDRAICQHNGGRVIDCVINNKKEEGVSPHRSRWALSASDIAAVRDMAASLENSTGRRAAS